MTEPLVEATNVKKYYPITRGILLRRVFGHIKAVDGVTLSIHRGEVFGLVGESGSGKTTLARILSGVTKPTEGEVIFNSLKINQAKGRLLRQLRREIGFIYQNPYLSLDPRKTVFDIVSEPLRVHGYEGSIVERVLQLLATVGLRPEDIQKYPHMFSGGQRQRIVIARALALSPQFVIADEPTSSLDVSVQAKIINLLKDVRNRFNLTILIISHDLSVVRQISDRVGVMYLGKMVELGAADKVLLTPLHPYTHVLVSCIPVPEPTVMRSRQIKIEGELSYSTYSSSGCIYAHRCPLATEKCRRVEPELEWAQEDHMVACHYWRNMTQNNVLQTP